MHRLAGNALKWLFSRPGAVKGAPDELLKAGDLAFRLIPDIGFAGLTAATTPGDVFDKATAAGTQLIGGTGLGLAAGRLGGRNKDIAGLLDMAGSVGGDFAAMPIGDAIMRGKDKVMGGEGLTPYERMSVEQEQAIRESAQTQILAQMGLLPNDYQTVLVDPTLSASGLGG
jgi:hypothetical protein